MTRRRTGFWIAVALVTGVVIAGLIARQAWHDLLTANGIDRLDWQGFDLGLSGLSAESLSIHQRQPGHDLSLTASDLSLAWDWQGLRPQATSLRFGDLLLRMHTHPPTDAEPDSPGATNPFQAWPRWLPETITAHRFNVSLPCRTGQCELNGSATLERSEGGLPMTLNLQLQQAAHRIDLKATLNGQLRQKLKASAQLTIDDQPTLTTQTEYSSGPTHHWTGTARIPEWTRSPWLVDWLRQWTPVSDDALPAQPAAAKLDARWDLDWPDGRTPLASASGSIALKGELTQPWPVPGVGTVSGELAVDLTASQGQWQARALRSDLTLTHPAGWSEALPELVRPDTITLKARPVEPKGEVPSGTLPLFATLTAKGPGQLTLEGNVALTLTSPWSVAFDQTRVTGRLPTTQVGGWQLASPRLDLKLSGQADATSLTLKTGPDAHATLVRLTAPDHLDLKLETVRGDMPSLSVKARYRTDEPVLESLQVKGPVWLSAGQIAHPQLQPQSWRFKGSLAGSLKQLSLDGQLTSKAGATTTVALGVPFGGDLSAQFTNRIQAPKDSEAWASTLAAWPKVLDLSAGTIDADTTLTQTASGPFQFDSTARFQGVAGTFNRTAWGGLSGPVSIGIRDQRLSVRVPDLSIKQINPGVPIGPTRLAANYTADLEQPAAGQLTLNQAKADMVGGQVQVPAQRWNLAHLPIRVPLKIEKLDLERLMRLYPSEDLSGTGQLSGTLPVRIGRDGVAVEGGDLKALSPGGRLVLPGSRLQALAGDNMAMGIVAEAMKNFHYSVLDSTIDYDRDGTLQLGLHIEGKNPDVHDGQPVVLNVNLQEDIPALLTSLQLSGRVNNTVTERVKKLIEQRQNDKTKEQ